ncbi:MAG: hypothetical protein OXC99_08635 [Chloroflexi bacterium]|nr:hypothetical protein [Chloroflexota bacterium]
MVIRRVIALALALALAPMLILALLTSQACGTVLSSDFYKEQLREADIYNFLYDELLPVAVEEGLHNADGVAPAFKLDADFVVTSIRDALPPDWLQQQTEGAIDSLGPYLLGQSDSFTLTISPDERAEAVEAAIIALIDRVDLHQWLLEERAPETVQNRLDSQDLPLGIQLTSDEALVSLERVVTPEYVRSQQTGAAKALAAYLTGRSDSFSFTFDFSDRAAPLEEEMTAILDRADLSGYVRQEALDPALDENVTEDVALPFDVVVSREEIRAAIESAITDEWLAVESRRLVDAAVPYISGRSDGFALRISLRERTEASILALTEAVKKTYADRLEAAPPCTPAQALALARGNPVGLCSQPGVTADGFLRDAGVDVDALLSAAVHDMAPGEVTFTHEDLTEATQGGEDSDLIAEVREAMRDGWTVSEEDLRDALAGQDSGLVDALDTVREGFSEGWTWTEEDLREAIADPDSADAEESLDAFDLARDGVNSLRIVGPLLLALSLGLVAGAGLLGGRRWPVKLGLGGSALLAAALGALLVTFIAAGLGGVVSDAQAEAAAEAAQTQGDERVEALLSAKLLGVVDRGIGRVIGGMRLQALLLALLGAAAVAGGVVWARQKPRQAPTPEGGAPGRPPPPAPQEKAPPVDEEPTEDSGPQEGDAPPASEDSPEEPEASPDGAPSGEESGPQEGDASTGDAPPADDSEPEEPQAPDENRPV